MTFETRTFERTGVNLRDMDTLILADGDGIPGVIFLREGDNYVVGVGIPDDIEDEAHFKEFLHIIIVEDKDIPYDEIRWPSGPEEVLYTRPLGELIADLKEDGIDVVYPHIYDDGDVVGTIKPNPDSLIAKLRAEIAALKAR